MRAQKSTKDDPRRQVNCRHCGKRFIKRQVGMQVVFCSKECRLLAWAKTAPPVRDCKWCKGPFTPPRGNPGTYCSMKCKAEWQKTQKPVMHDWLYEKYVIEGRTCPEIAAIVERHPKRVWEWLRDLGIPTRPRGSYWEQQPAFCFWKTPGGKNPNLGRKFGPEFCKKQSEIAKAQGRVPFDPAVGSYMKGRKGADTPNWKGGVTPERLAFYSTLEWKAAVRAIWIRDNATCQRCGKRNSGKERFAFDIHHIVSFAYAPLRAEVSNLVLLCEKCHYWVHSNENIDRLFIKEIPSAVE